MLRHALLLLTALGASALTECQKCCAPGGDCSKASKGERGTCCGQVAGNDFCCPHFTLAKCWECNNAYRCYTGSRPSPNICAAEGGSAGREPPVSSVYPRYGRSGGGESPLVSLIITLVCFSLVASAITSCARNRRQLPIVHQQGLPMAPVPVAYPIGPDGKPMGSGVPMASAVPVAGMPVGAYPAGAYAQQGAYPARGGYGGGSVAAGAGMGFLGGMMMGNMLGGGMGGYGGGDGGGGGGGGDFGGDFAADM